MKKTTLVFLYLLNFFVLSTQSLCGEVRENFKYVEKEVYNALTSVKESKKIFYPVNAKEDSLRFIAKEVHSLVADYNKLVEAVNYDLNSRRFSRAIGRYGVTQSDLPELLSEDLITFNLSDYLEFSSVELIRMGHRYRIERSEILRVLDKSYVPTEMKMAIEKLSNELVEYEKNLRNIDPKYKELKRIEQEWDNYLKQVKVTDKSVRINNLLTVKESDLVEQIRENRTKQVLKVGQYLFQDPEYRKMSLLKGELESKRDLLIGEKSKTLNPELFKLLINLSIKDEICSSILRFRGDFN